MFKNYILTTFRNLARHKVNTLINVAGLATSIACCLFIYVLVRHENSFDHFHPQADRIYRVVTDGKGANGPWHAGYVSFALVNALRTDMPHLETITQAYGPSNGIIRIPTSNGSKKMFEEREILYTDSDFLKTFPYEFLVRQSGTLLSNPDEVVLTRQLADKFFGQAYASRYHDLLGKTILVNQEPYQISGILRDIPRNTNVPFRMILPFQAFTKNNPGLTENWKNVYSESYAFVKLPERTSAEEVNRALIPFAKKYHAFEPDAQRNYHLQPLKQVHTDETYGGTVYASPSILIIAFFSKGLIVLLTACINFINLGTAHSLKRAREIGIRKTLGGRQWQLVLQFMSETFVLIVLATGVALLLASQFIEVFNHYLFEAIALDMNLHLERSVTWFLAGLAVLITLLAGYYPARVMAGFPPIQALRGRLLNRNVGFAGGFSMRKGLVVTQFMVSQLLIIGTIVVAVQMRFIHTRDLGYVKDGILTVRVPENNPQKLSVFRNQVTALAGVQNLSYSSGPPTSASNSFGTFRAKSAPQTDNMDIERKFVDPNYLDTYGIKLVAGRNLLDTDKVGSGDSARRYNVVVNRRTIQDLGFKAPDQALGHTFVVDDGDRATIVGVVENFYNVTLQYQIKPCLLFYSTGWVDMANIRLDARTDKATLGAIQKAWEAQFPSAIYTALGLDEYFRSRAFYLMEDLMYNAFKIFSGFAIMIGCLGLYGLVSFLALQRQKEIGIRKVLGASVSGIVYLFSKEFAWLVVLAFLIAAPLGFMAMKSWLETFANRIDLHPAYFIIGFVLSVLIAAITVSFQAIRAAMANPVKSLRSE